jgi:LysM repeat protein
VYSISKEFNTNVETILMWNNLSGPAIQAGQEIIVGYETPTLAVIGPLPGGHDNNVAKKESQLSSTSKTDKSSEDISNNEPGRNAMMKFYSEKGIAAWSKSTYDDGNFYAMHADAPKGTEITIKNLMNNKTIRVKVIGKLPATAENENIMIRISESAAKQLNALDEKSLVEITYNAEELVSVSGTN